jgi:hypothetical protein
MKNVMRISEKEVLKNLIKEKLLTSPRNKSLGVLLLYEEFFLK